MYTGLAVVLASLAGFRIWDKYLANDEYRAYQETESRYSEAMTQDTYGGKTQEETISLFITALKAKDVDLASKYFILDSNLSRDRWLRTLTIFKEQGILDDMVSDIEKNPSIVELKFNEYSHVWKVVNFK